MKNMSGSSIESGKIIAFIFDSGKIDDCFYGNIVFKNIFSGKEVMTNPRKIIVSLGDIMDYNVFNDITPYVIRNELCTIKKCEERYKNNLFVFLLEDIDAAIAQRIDARLHKNFNAYVGMTSVDINSTDVRKQFWKSLIRSFSIEFDSIISFGIAEEEAFNYYEAALELGFRVSYDNFPYEIDGYNDNLFSTRQSTMIRSADQLTFVDGRNDSDRGIIEMNFSLVKEVELAGVQIWKAIEDINQVVVSKENSKYQSTIIDYLFTSLYQASQGIERLLKVIIELYAYDKTDNKEIGEINNLLFSHNHSAMYDFLNQKCGLKIKPNCKKLLTALTTFYSKVRYHRYSYSNDDTLELTILRDFGADISDDNFDAAVKHLYGKAIGQTSHAFYNFIVELSHKLNIFVYELNYDSVANFSLNSQYGDDLYGLLKQIEQSKKELIWYLIKEGNKLPVVKYSCTLPPLPFDPCNIPELLSDLIANKNSCGLLYDFVSNEYDELVEQNKNEWKNRIEAIDVLVGNDNVCFEEFDEPCGDDDISTNE